jgi:hypothetical protein
MIGRRDFEIGVFGLSRSSSKFEVAQKSLGGNERKMYNCSYFVW